MNVIYDLNLQMDITLDHTFHSNSNSPRPTNSERVTLVHNTFVMS